MNFSIHSFETLSSTLDEAADAKYRHGDLIVARFQNAGRGQRGNAWRSDSGLNLMATLVVEPTHIAVNEQFVLSMIASVATAATVRSFGVEGVKIKWPNDIYVEQEKISGILIEHSFSSEMLDRSLIGIGINVEQSRFDSGAGSPTSLRLLGVKGATVEVVRDRLCEEFARAYCLPISELHQLFVGQLYRKEGYFRYCDASGAFTARIEAIDPHSGVITLVDEADCRREYYFKEVAYL